MLKIELEESEEAMIARFVSGLRKDIQDFVELQEYSSMGSLVHLAMKVEAQLAKKNSFKNASNDGYYSKSWQYLRKILDKFGVTNLKHVSTSLAFYYLDCLEVLDRIVV